MFSFGKKRVKVHRKPPARLIKLCKKYRIKTTRKVGKRKLYKSITVLKRQIKKKIRGSSFGKKKKVIKLPNNTRGSKTLKGYNTMGTIVLRINGKINRYRIKNKNIVKIGKNVYRFKPSNKSTRVTLYKR